MERKRPPRPQDCVIPFGPYKDQTLNQIYQSDPAYIRTLMDSVDDLCGWSELHRVISGIKPRKHVVDKENTTRQSLPRQSTRDDDRIGVAGPSNSRKSVLCPPVRAITPGATDYPHTVDEQKEHQTDTNQPKRPSVPRLATTSRTSMARSPPAPVTVNKQRAAPRIPEAPGTSLPQKPRLSTAASISVPGAFPAVLEGSSRSLKDKDTQSFSSKTLSTSPHVAKASRLIDCPSVLSTVEQQMNPQTAFVKPLDHPESGDQEVPTVPRLSQASDVDTPMEIDDHHVEEARTRSAVGSDPLRSTEANVAARPSAEEAENHNATTRGHMASPGGLRRPRHGNHGLEPDKKRRMTSSEAVQEIHSHVRDVETRLYSTGHWLHRETDGFITRAASQLENKVEKSNLDIHNHLKDFQLQFERRYYENNVWLRDHVVPAHRAFVDLRGHISNQLQDHSTLRIAEVSRLNTSIRSTSRHVQSRLRRIQLRQQFQFRGVRSRLERLRSEFQSLQTTIQHQGNGFHSTVQRNTDTLTHRLDLLQQGPTTSVQPQDFRDLSESLTSSMELTSSTVKEILREVQAEMNPNEPSQVEGLDRRTLYQTLGTIETTVQQLATACIPGSTDASEQAPDPTLSGTENALSGMVHRMQAQLGKLESLLERTDALALERLPDRHVEPADHTPPSTDLAALMQQQHGVVLEHLQFLRQRVEIPPPELSQGEVEEMNDLLLKIDDAHRAQSRVESYIHENLRAELAHVRNLCARSVASAAVERDRSKITWEARVQADRLEEEDRLCLRQREESYAAVMQAMEFIAEANQQHLEHQLYRERRRNALREARLQYLPTWVDPTIDWHLELIASQTKSIQLLADINSIRTTEPSALARPVDALGHVLPSALPDNAIGRDLPSALELATSLFRLRAENTVQMEAERVHEEDSARLFRGLEGMRKRIAEGDGQIDLMWVKSAIENLQVGREWI